VAEPSKAEAPAQDIAAPKSEESSDAN